MDFDAVEWAGYCLGSGTSFALHARQVATQFARTPDALVTAMQTAVAEQPSAVMDAAVVTRSDIAADRAMNPDDA